MRITLLISLLLSPFAIAEVNDDMSFLCTKTSYSYTTGFYHPNNQPIDQRYVVCLNGSDVTGIIAEDGYITSSLDIYNSGGTDMLYTVHNDYENSPGYVVHAFVDGNNDIFRDIIMYEHQADDPKHTLLNLRLNWLSKSGFVYLSSNTLDAPPSIYSFVIPTNAARTSWKPKKQQYIISGNFLSSGDLSSYAPNHERFVVEQTKAGERGLETFTNLVSYNGTKICEIDTFSRFWQSELRCK